MNITIIAGSQRPNSQSLNVANYLATLADQHFEQVNVLDLHQLNLPFWNEGCGKVAKNGRHSSPLDSS